VILLGCHSLLSADEIKLGEYLTVDVEDRDYTYQSFPDMGIDEESGMPFYALYYFYPVAS